MVAPTLTLSSASFAPTAGFTFYVTAGKVTRTLADGTSAIVALGAWSGHGVGRNAPWQDSLKGVGPLPLGLYTIGALLVDGGHLGPHILPLARVTPAPGVGVNSGPTYGRGSFYIHGASVDPAKAANSSDGCIILPRSVRDLINTAHPVGDKLRSILVLA